MGLDQMKMVWEHIKAKRDITLPGLGDISARRIPHLSKGHAMQEAVGMDYGSEEIDEEVSACKAGCWLFDQSWRAFVLVRAFLLCATCLVLVTGKRKRRWKMQNSRGTAQSYFWSLLLACPSDKGKGCTVNSAI